MAEDDRDLDWWQTYFQEDTSEEPSYSLADSPTDFVSNLGFLQPAEEVLPPEHFAFDYLDLPPPLPLLSPLPSPIQSPLASPEPCSPLPQIDPTDPREVNEAPLLLLTFPIASLQEACKTIRGKASATAVSATIIGNTAPSTSGDQQLSLKLNIGGPQSAFTAVRRVAAEPPVPIYKDCSSRSSGSTRPPSPIYKVRSCSSRSSGSTGPPAPIYVVPDCSSRSSGSTRPPSPIYKVRDCSSRSSGSTGPPAPIYVVPDCSSRSSGSTRPPSPIYKVRDCSSRSSGSTGPPAPVDKVLDYSSDSSGSTRPPSPIYKILDYSSDSSGSAEPPALMYKILNFSSGSVWLPVPICKVLDYGSDGSDCTGPPAPIYKVLDNSSGSSGSTWPQQTPRAPKTPRGNRRRKSTMEEEHVVYLPPLAKKSSPSVSAPKMDVKPDVARPEETSMEEESHLCNLCFMSFPTVNQVRRHQGRDHGMKLSQCSTCDDLFCQQSSLIVHELAFHRYLCLVCLKIFTRPKKVCEHGLERHHAYVCDLCFEPFATIESRCAHKAAGHGSVKD